MAEGAQPGDQQQLAQLVQEQPQPVQQQMAPVAQQPAQPDDAQQPVQQVAQQASEAQQPVQQVAQQPASSPAQQPVQQVAQQLASSAAQQGVTVQAASQLLSLFAQQAEPVFAQVLPATFQWYWGELQKSCMLHNAEAAVRPDLMLIPDAAQTFQATQQGIA